jgi:uncharacterized membrane protein YqjE
MSAVGAILSRVVDKARRADSPLADRDSQSVAALVHRLTRELASLFRQELALAGAEFTHALSRTVAGAVLAVAGCVVLFAGLLALLTAAILGLSHIMTAWLAALLAGSVVSVMGLTTLFVGLRAVKKQSLKPHRASRSLSRDKDVITRKKS